jgi:hypothetical protein
MLGRSRCRVGSPDLLKFAAVRTQNLGACRSIAWCSLFVALVHMQYVDMEKM